MKVTNKAAYFDYELGERIEAGIVLSGAETKSIKAGSVEMGQAYVRIINPKSQILNPKFGKEAWVIGMHIYPYVHADSKNYIADRSRKLLLHKKEIIALEAKMKSGGRTLVPTALYDKHGRIKMELALARGKRKYEKREIIKKRDLDRDATF